MTRSGTFLLISLFCAGPVVAAQAPDSVLASPQQNYEAGLLHRLLLGSHYRELWSLPVRAEVLDLSRHAGGLTPTGLGGGQQTRSLRFRGADGRRYVFRVIDKDASRSLDPALRQSIAARVLQDQVSALLPGSPLVVAHLLEAAGVLHADPLLFVMPDDARLGEFRADFAGLLGYIEERPDEGPDGEPGFAGATRVEDSEALAERLESSPRHVIDDRALVLARLLDAFVGDWDRHPDQWLWAGFQEADRTRWAPIPRDRDWALAQLDGLLVWMAGFAFPNYKGFDSEYPSAFRLSWTGRALDRTLLSGTPAAVWDSIAAALASRLSDEVIDAAVARLPPPWLERVGPDLVEALRRRRDDLPSFAREYYRLLAGWVDILATDVDEHARIERHADGRLRVAVFVRAGTAAGEAPAGEPHFERVFVPGETREVRLYLRGGDDVAVVEGRGGTITVRVVGGGGDDLLIDRSDGDAVRFYDDRGTNRFETADRTRVDESEFEQRLDTGSRTANAPARDWGSWWVPVPYFAYEPDAGWYFGGGAIRYGYGFRDYPWRTRLSVSAGVGTGAAGFRGSLSYDFPLAGEVRARFDASYSGADRDNFFGYGNTTRETGDRSFYRADSQNTQVSLMAVLRPSAGIELSAGPVYRGSRPFGPGARLVDSLGVYGHGDFDEAGVHARLTTDTRNRRTAASKGILIRVDTRYFPRLLDVDRPFGGVRALASTYLSADTAGRPVLALRVGGEKIWGVAPYQEAAYLGGAGTLRGFANRRFAGTASLFGNAELRVPVADVFITLPANIGAFVLLDGGRVFVGGESSDVWHSAAGGGLFLAALSPANVLSLAIVRSTERTGVYVRAGFAF